MPCPAPDTIDTRSRILQAAQRLFRKRGYHATGLSDILDLAQAPKGSMYHHFPGGKEAIGVAVIEAITLDLLQLFVQHAARTTQAQVLKAGLQLVQVAEKTNYEMCALFSSFIAERKSSPLLGHAVEQAYAQMVNSLQARLVQDGWSNRAATDKAQVVLALLEGGSMLAQAQRSTRSFSLAVKQAAALCVLPTPSALPRTP